MGNIILRGLQPPKILNIRLFQLNGEHTISARCGNKPLSKDAFYGMVADIKASVAG